jgi:hypothetical protein
MKLLKFNEFLNEDIVPLGFAMSSRPSYYTLSSSQIRTGYDMQPVAGPMVTASDSVANSAIDHENNDNPDHTGRGYINEALKVFKEKCNEAYESKCNEALKESGIDTSRYKRSHGKNPTGFGGWGFFFDNDKEPVFTPNAMNYADAVKWAKGKAKELGKTTIYVAESSDINESMNVKDFFKDPMHAADASGWIFNPKLSDNEIRTKIKALMKDPSKFNDLMDAMTDELNLKWK